MARRHILPSTAIRVGHYIQAETLMFLARVYCRQKYLTVELIFVSIRRVHKNHVDAIIRLGSPKLSLWISSLRRSVKQKTVQLWRVVGHFSPEKFVDACFCTPGMTAKAGVAQW